MDRIENKPNATRLYYLDLMRIVGILAVITTHVSAYSMFSEPIHTYDWRVLNIYNASSRFAVPVFVMISGVLWLNPNKKVTISGLYKKNIGKLLASFFIWSWIYAISEMIGKGIELKPATLPYFLKACLKGHYHMWFIYMMIGLYIITPLLRKISTDISLFKYFMILAFITSILLPTLQDMTILLWTKEITDNLSIQMGGGYIFYFMLGYYISNIKIDKKVSILIYIGGIVGWLAMALLTKNMSFEQNEVITYYENLNVLCMAEAVAMFLLIKSVGEKILTKKNVCIIVEKLSRYSFSIYICHDLIIQVLLVLGLTAVSFNPIIGLPVIVLTSAALAFLLSWGLCKIPFYRRLFV